MGEIIVRRETEVAQIQDICGQLRLLTRSYDFSGGNVVTVEMRGASAPHFHALTTEFYFVIGGPGTIVAGRQIIAANAGTLVLIPTGTAHYVIPRNVMKLVVFAVPAWQKSDEFVLEEDNAEVDYYVALHKKLLIDELVARLPVNASVMITSQERAAIASAKRYDEMSVSALSRLLAYK